VTERIAEVPDEPAPPDPQPVPRPLVIPPLPKPMGNGTVHRAVPIRHLPRKGATEHLPAFDNGDPHSTGLI
jgi:hypothetical protein